MTTRRHVAWLRRAHFEETRQLRGHTDVDRPMIAIDCQECLGKLAIDTAHTGRLSCDCSELARGTRSRCSTMAAGNVDACRLL